MIDTGDNGGDRLGAAARKFYDRLRARGIRGREEELEHSANALYDLQWDL